MANGAYDSVVATTDGDGAATVYLGPFTGRLSILRYTKTDFTDGVDFAVTTETSGQTLWTGTNVNATVTIAPRQATHSTAGAAALYASGGTAVNDHILICNERIKVVVSDGGDTKTGAFAAVVEGSK